MAQAQITVAQRTASKRQATLGLVAVFATYFASSHFFRGAGVTLPNIAADLNGIHLYSWAISLPGWLTRRLWRRWPTREYCCRRMRWRSSRRPSIHLATVGPRSLRKVQAIRGLLEASLKLVFLIGAVTSLVSFLLILIIPEVPIDAEVQDKKR